jgi:hypothetical protein
MLSRRRRFFHQGGVLLRHLVHLADGVDHLQDAIALFGRGGADLAHDVADLLDGADDLVHGLAGLVDQGRALIHLLDVAGDQALDLPAASALRWASVRTSPATTAKPRPCSRHARLPPRHSGPGCWSGRRCRRSRR